jgi:Fe-S-cluster-containing dehydrogenase component/formate-dependent nitrite reductase membrane component NrfD
VTRWSWVIDQTRCIGCHACTTACKSENDVALGVFRTWVKNVDVGTFPAVRRHFAVLRCNHCEDAPCVEICPVTAMYQRADGLVDFDEDICIGCKACMQACPYDAIYMDPDTDTAAKCNFCSHRVDAGLLPACVVVCPVEALVFGDLDDPTSAARRRLDGRPVAVRRPEQRTKPKAFYLGAHEATLDPLAADHGPMYAWADRTGEGSAAPRQRDTARRPAGPPARVSYDIPKSRPWGWRVSSYIWTKSIAAGAGLVPAFMHAAGATPGTILRVAAPALALVMLGLTGVLLVADLKRPERFWTILVRPQWRSWLARGAYVITLYGLLLFGWAAASWTGAERWLDVLAWPVVLLALATAVYTAFLFTQCEGRDLWQSRLLALDLLVHAPVAALAAFLVIAPWIGGDAWTVSWAEAAAAGLVLAAILSLADAFRRHATANATLAARALTRGPEASLFWAALCAGALLPAGLFVAGPIAWHPAAGLLALAGLWLQGHALVRAGQRPAIS